MDYSILSDEELVGLLYTGEDRLPRVAVDEFIRRGDRVVPCLSEIVSSQFNWTKDTPEWWSVVHASFILGAIGTETVITPLLRALRWADAFDCDWVTETLPAMFGRIGPAAVFSLKTMAADQTNGCFARSLAMDGLGSIALRDHGAKEDISAFMYSIFMDGNNDMHIRQSAGNVLLDLRCAQYRGSLLAFGREERARKDRDRFYPAYFFDNDVEMALGDNGGDIVVYDRDWLLFYDEKEIEVRHQRWQEERQAMAEEKDRAAKIWTRSPINVGRNEPCPCGSGKKFKKCCLDRAE